MKLLLWIGVATCLFTASAHARAEVTQKDLQVTARALSFLESPFVGETRVGILYDPESDRSTRQAEKVRMMLTGGLTVGELSLVPIMVPIDRAVNANVDLFFLTEYLGGLSATISELVSSKAVPCVTTDIAQVRKGACAMAIQSATKVRVLVNRQAADMTGMKFTTVFRVMITEL